MPILLLGLMALAVFLVMGLLLFSATISERRTRERAAGGPPPGSAPVDNHAKTRAAHA